MQIKVHETEYYHSNLNPVFQPFELKLQKLCNGDHLRPIRIELWDYNSNGEHKIVGNLDFTIHQISAENKKEFQLKDPSKKKIMGSIIFEQATLISKPEFIDYLRGGVQLSLIVAIDFTGKIKLFFYVKFIFFMKKYYQNNKNHIFDIFIQVLMEFLQDLILCML